jgi:hypothetical protein
MGTVSWAAGSLPGTKLVDLPFSPLSSAFLQTRLANIAAAYGRYRLKNCTMIYSPALSATTGGQLAMAFLSDPQTVIPDEGGPEVVRMITDSAGSDLFQVWSPAVAGYPGNVETEPFYTQPDPDEDNQLLISAGRMVIINMTEQADAGSAGTWEIAYEVEFEQPTLETFAVIAKWSHITGGTGASSCTDALPLGLAVPPALTTDQIGITGLSGSGFTLPAGSWVFNWHLIVTTSVSYTTADFLNANVAANPNASFNYVTQIRAASGVELFTQMTVISQEPITLVFGSGVTGLTGDSVVAGENQVYVYSDPLSFPTKTFGRSKRSLAKANQSTKDRCLSQLASERERVVLGELDEIKRIIAGQRPGQAVPQFTYQAFSDPRSPAPTTF